MHLEVIYQRQVDDHVVIVVSENTSLFEEITEYPIKRAEISHSLCIPDEICEPSIDLFLKKEC